jgi:hypothetical protein
VKIEDCTDDICRMLLEHAVRQGQLAWLFAIGGVVLILIVIFGRRRESKNPPEGWKLVPTKMTKEMRLASKGAVYRYIKNLSAAELDKLPRYEDGEPRITQNRKHEMRYEAAVSAAPEAPAVNDKTKKVSHGVA